MVGIVIVSHSSEIAHGVKCLVEQMSPGGNIASAGGTSDGKLGTDVDKIKNAVMEVYSEDGVLILFDLGSAYMNAQIAVEFLDEDIQSKVEIINAALVEGALTASVDSSIGKTRDEIKKNLKSLSINKMPSQ
ncbi:dihydroxyacetone kinase phosphoryl donor subunit DhaM [Clostridium luticellarii]|jgi:dihydroxyacetone kinase phosphotransfer subunit|uniref:phosphoenolpyruvate--glycerone phosphotransferase n=1 Tax=Clostridium luticellarii TaxID=1691940 RepID=A0A2T0BAI2_9CLOT|nr:dihydroxyacetone kinase phosphoryl donor subunit DhaM [Clostridium luticellarii]MCI1944252.1 PTS-dependent dihydroxyacetone kinase phosphotransferase subunit DhaM [Clostridium luticellarii]MCI1967748.1 PTS-dependent dihydroxyacetone kinase phosphotransferase subunit DhaM [Clostridium luticellarii]MCI1994626.1 PTS-dependent dihydroxyacetone kinase phosphotransferase subunit DhaM [Clostridium luticellarii]MCI2038877.1 PTS-dependent dihydroxyacetone kinase phosphotransferase subunit DhaM [Clost